MDTDKQILFRLLTCSILKTSVLDFFREHRDYNVYHNLNEQLENCGISAVTNLLDSSFCASLYLMNREGFSIMSRSIDWISIQNGIDKGASYFIAHDSLLHNQTELEPFKQHLVGNFKAL